MTGTLRIGMVGAGTMAGAHSTALINVPHLFPDLPLRSRLVAVADVDRTLAERLAARWSFERVEPDWRSLVASDDIDLIVVCVPPAYATEIVLAAAEAGKHVVCEKPLGTTADEAAAMLHACRKAGVFHGLGAGYRWSPAVRAIQHLVGEGRLGEIRSMRASFLLDYAADPDVPLLWRFRRAASGGGIAIDTGYHLVDLARFMVGEIESVQGLARKFVTSRPLPAQGVVGNRGGDAASGGAVVDDAGRVRNAPRGDVDVEDAAAALVTFASGAYGVLETSRVTIGRRISLQLEVFGSTGSAAWDLERPDEFAVCLPDDLFTFGYRRVLVNPDHPGAAQLLVAGTDGTSIGWLGQECAMWAEFLTAIGQGRRGSADFEDGVRDGAVIDALYASAASGGRVAVRVPSMT